MSQSILSLLVLAGIAIFLILRLRSVLGTRDGFEKPRVDPSERMGVPDRDRRGFEVIDGGPDHDILDHVPEGSTAAANLAAMKRVEPSFNVTEFLGGARQAYEMILMDFERGDLENIRAFLSNDVYAAFDSVVQSRREAGLSVDANFVGLRELKLVDADFDRDTNEGEMQVRFTAELTSVVRNEAGEIVEGDPNEIKTQRDVWTFGRVMGSNDPNWQLVATGD